MQDYLKTILSQYSGSPTLLALIDATNSSVDPVLKIDDFFNDIWNIDTAIGYGLDVWGRILGISRNLEIRGPITDSNYFGFHTFVLDNWQPFDQAPFYNENSSGTVTYTLADDAYRTLLLFKAFANITATNIPTLNRLLTTLFIGLGNPSPRCFVVDNGAMTMSYAFSFALTPIQQAIVTAQGVLPHPTGVQVNVIIFVPGSNFGFFEMGAGIQPFDQGTFL